MNMGLCRTHVLVRASRLELLVGYFFAGSVRLRAVNTVPGQYMDMKDMIIFASQFFLPVDVSSPEY